MSRTGSTLLLVCLIGLSGCRTFSSTMLNRLGDNSFVGNSNGYSDAASGARPFKGVPITLRVPSHLDVYIEEVYYLQDNGANSATVTEPLAGTRILKVKTELIKTKKVFTVDYKRPGSGTLNLDTKFTDEQYFQSISESLSDTTIVDSANLLSTILGGSNDATATETLPPLFAPSTPTPDAAHNATKIPTGGPQTMQATLMTNLLRDTRIVAYQRFDINEPDFEMQVDAFVSQHLNHCDRCGQSPTYDNN